MLARGILLVLSLVGAASAGNTTCLNNSMDWFTQSVGETPCRAFERLRGTCSPGYQVENMPNTAPGAVCHDQVAACCCNSVAFALSMLCMSCQWGIGSGVNQDYGFDAPKDTYAKYLDGCAPIMNQTLPDAVQIAMCKQNIKIPSYVYNPSWTSTGEWYFYYTRQSAELAINSGKNETGICSDLLLKAAASSSSLASATQSLSFPSTIYDIPQVQKIPVPVGAIVGGVLGGLALLAGGVIAGYMFRKRQMNRGTVDLIEDPKVVMPYVSYSTSHPGPAPVQPPAPTTYATESTGWAYGTGASSSSEVHGQNPAPMVSPVITTASRNQKERIMANSRSSEEAASSRPLLRSVDSGEESQVGTGGTTVSAELPPVYEPRR